MLAASQRFNHFINLKLTIISIKEYKEQFWCNSSTESCGDSGEGAEPSNCTKHEQRK